MSSFPQVILAILRRLCSLGHSVVRRIRPYFALLAAFLARRLHILIPKLWTGHLRYPFSGDTQPTYPPKSLWNNDRPVTIAASLLPMSASHSNPNLRASQEGSSPTIRRPMSSVFPSATAHADPLAMHSWHNLNLTPASLYHTRNMSVQTIADQRARLATIHANASVRSSVGGVPVQQFSRAPGAQFTSAGASMRARSGASSRTASRSRGASPQPSRVGSPLPSRRASPVRAKPNGPPTLQPLSRTVTPPMAPHTASQSPVEFQGVTVQSPSTESLPYPYAVIPIPSGSGSSCESLAVSVDDSTTVRTHWTIDIPQPPLGRMIMMICVDEVYRYQDRPKIESQETPTFFIQPVTINFPHSDTHTSGDWTPATHPDGALYFYHKEKRVYTDQYLYDPAILDEINEFADYLAALVETDPDLGLPSDDIDLVLDLNPVDAENMQWRYYYVDHKSRILFWIHEYPADFLICEAKGASSPAHIRLRLEDQYWCHWYMYPACPESRKLPEGTYEELLGILAHGAIDVMISPTSTTPYSVEDMRAMSGVIKEARSAGAESSDQLVCCVGRIMGHFFHWRFLYFHGQKAARLDQGRSLHGDVSHPRSLLIALLSPLLFYAPEIHLKEIEKLWADQIIVAMAWKRFITRLQSEWQEFILYSTVMLTVDVGFLAIPNVIIVENGNVTATSPAQIICYLSILFSIGSIVVGLLLVRHNRTREREKPEGASQYMTRNLRPVVGLEPLAIIHSVPYALLMWAMLMFLVALLLLCFWNTQFVTRMPVGINAVAVSGLILWCIVHAWDTGDKAGQVWIDGLVPSVKRTLERIERRWKGYWEMLILKKTTSDGVEEGSQEDGVTTVSVPMETIHEDLGLDNV
ncbi:hypothetical protein BV25DRAFT_1820257 [Artomyces pyxidatus]|uniref:Uncharacterized protein n=1 Tax=Artomyces pyxidatus TaxID=48021 RepID=A0ACB8TF93_9AGAM|nr:hypothetical protein BV25DRAFT_1820257 [Artomyces pyxidatus]